MGGLCVSAKRGVNTQTFGRIEQVRSPTSVFSQASAALLHFLNSQSSADGIAKQMNVYQWDLALTGSQRDLDDAVAAFENNPILARDVRVRSLQFRLLPK
jgi:hypothetical protein